MLVQILKRDITQPKIEEVLLEVLFSSCIHPLYRVAHSFTVRSCAAACRASRVCAFNVFPIGSTDDTNHWRSVFTAPYTFVGEKVEFITVNAKAVDYKVLRFDHRSDPEV